MTGPHCDREIEVRDAGASGRWTQGLRQHASECSTCRDVALVATAFASLPGTGRITANPALLWELARQARRLRAEAQISRIITVTKIVAAFLSGAAIVGLVTRFATWPASWSALVPGDDDRAVLYGATGLLLVAVFAVSRWMSDEQERT